MPRIISPNQTKRKLKLNYAAPQEIIDTISEEDFPDGLKKNMSLRM